MSTCTFYRVAVNISFNKSAIHKSVLTAPKCKQKLSQVRSKYSWPDYGSRYGFTNWPMKKDFHKREIVKEQYPQRMRLNAIRKNSILPPEIQGLPEVEEDATRINIRIITSMGMERTPLGTDAPQQIADKEVAALPRNSNPIRLVDRCVLTSRPRGTKRQYRVSRIMYRLFADYNKMSGVTRAKW